MLELFSLGSSDRMSENGSMWFQVRFRVDFRNPPLPRGWQVLEEVPREMVDAPTLSVLKRCLDNAFYNMP